MFEIIYSRKIFFFIIGSLILLSSCAKEEIELEENTIAFMLDGERIKTTGNENPPNTLKVRGSKVNNNVHIEVRFGGKRLFLSITDTLEQVYEMNNDATLLRFFDLDNCGAFREKKHSGTIEITKWDSKKGICKGRFSADTELVTFDGIVDGPSFLEGEFNINIIANRGPILDSNYEINIKEHELDVLFDDFEIGNSIIFSDWYLKPDNFISLMITIPKSISEGIQNDNSKIAFLVNYNFSDYKNISEAQGKINISMMNTSFRYISLEIEDLVLTSVDDPNKTIVCDYACFKSPYSF